MPGFLKGSIFVSLLTACFNALARAYGFSRLKGFVSSCALCFKDCMIYRLCSKYFNKPYYFEYSLTLRFIKQIVGIVDIPMSLIGRFVRYIVSGSLFVAAGDALAAADAKGRLTAAGVIGVFIGIGFFIGSLIKGAAPGDYIMPGIILLFSVVILISTKFLDCIKNSVIYRFIVWLVKA